MDRWRSDGLGSPRISKQNRCALPLSAIRSSCVALVLSLSPTGPVLADGLAGSYLAGRAAGYSSDFRTAATYFTRALVRDPSNPALLESAISAFISLGEFDSALPVAQRLTALGANSQLANIVILADATSNGRYDAILSDLDAGASVMPLIDGMARAWSELGEGRMESAIAAFDDVIATDGLTNLGLYQKALALASAGDFASSDAIFSGDEAGPLRLDRRGIEARLQVLSQLERHDDALELIDAAFGADPQPEITELRKIYGAGAPVPFTAVRSAQDGMAEVFFAVASILSSETSPGYALLFSRTAEQLRSDNVDAIMLSADLLEDMERYELATQAYDLVPRTHPAFYSAEIGRAEALRRDNRIETAIEVLEQLTESHGHLPGVFVSLGDLLREQSDYSAASKAYDKSIALYDKPEDAPWRTYFVRGITYEREDRWEAAEADFRFALTLRPDEPRVLNYLGYSLVEMQEKLDEALVMIETAVEKSPDSGFIIDSLGWALYRLARYNEAVGHMERAVELMPLDPIINDHVGDVYWAVGRQREAEFQWKRALSLEPEDEDAIRIRRKLEIGLDLVLQEEGSDPISMANDG